MQISLLHIAVVTMLAGAVTLFVGLVQLKPGAEASRYRYVLIGSGLLFTLLGTIIAVIRCCLLPWVAKRRDRQRHQQSLKQTHHQYEHQHRRRSSSNNSMHRESLGDTPILAHGVNVNNITSSNERDGGVAVIGGVGNPSPDEVDGSDGGNCGTRHM